MPAITAELIRFYTPNATLGELTVRHPDGSSFQCHTIERPWEGNERNVSCIPEGVYTVKPHSSPKFGRCYWVQDVPGRSEILLHAGNTAGDVTGCIAPGMTLSPDQLAVWKSRPAMDALLDEVIGCRSFTLIIRQFTPEYP